MDIDIAQRHLYDRSRLAFTAAAAGLPGRFRAFRLDDLYVLLTTSPGLAFLNSISGVTPAALGSLPGVLSTFASAGAPAPILTSTEPTAALGEQLHDLGFAPSRPRPVAVIDLATHGIETGPGDAGQLRISEVTDHELPLFLHVLAAGYAAVEPVAAFVRHEHSSPGILRYLAWRGDEPVAAAAMSVHADVAVLGGAATLPAARGTGAQLALLRHRLDRATRAGHAAATATAAPDSPSLRNLTRVGFTICPRASWVGRSPTVAGG